MTQRWKGGRKKDRGRDIAVRGLEGRERERERGRLGKREVIPDALKVSRLQPGHNLA